jgi:hypothetical protein
MGGVDMAQQSRTSRMSKSLLKAGQVDGLKDDPRKAKFNQFLNAIAEGELNTVFRSNVSTQQTSNVFSQTIDVFTTEHYESP